MPQPAAPRTVGIAGAGLIGGSIGLAAAAAGYRVTAWDPRPQHLAVALERGLAHEAAHSFDDLAAAADLLVLAGPLEAILEQLAVLRDRPPAGRAVIDVASVKAPIAAAARGIATFVPTHPIAGSERSGPEAASAGLFARRVWTYDPSAPEAAREIVTAFLTSLGARPVALASDRHDRIVAMTSHLPQLVAVSLGTLLERHLGERDVAALCGTGMRSMIRLGASDWEVWRAIVGANAAILAQEVRGFTAILESVARALEEGRSEALTDEFDAAARAVARLDENDAVAASVLHVEHSHER